MSQLIILKTGYNPAILDASGIQLPMVLKNHKGEQLATICYAFGRKDKYEGFVNGHKIDCYGFPFDSVTECIEGVFGYLYQQMQDYRKEAEEYNEVRRALKKALDLR